MADSLLNSGTSGPATRTAKLVDEGLIGLAPASRIFGTGRNGRSRHPATLTKYINVGVRLPDGKVVKLEALRIGSAFMTSRAAVLRFLAAQQPTDDVADAGENQLPTPSARKRQQAAATAELDAALR